MILHGTYFIIDWPATLHLYTQETRNQVMTAGKYLLALFREVEKRILKNRTLKREMAAEDSIHNETVITMLD